MHFSLSLQLAARRQVPAVLQLGELQVSEEGFLVQRAEQRLREVCVEEPRMRHPKVMKRTASDLSSISFGGKSWIRRSFLAGTVYAEQFFATHRRADATVV